MIPVQNDNQTAVLSDAILIYKQKAKGLSPTKTIFASIHKVETTGGSKMEIMPGTPANKASLLALLESLTDKFTSSPDLLPEHVLSYSMSHLIWWTPACSRRVFFDCKEIGKRSAVVPHPALLFVISKNGWFVWALKDSKRPDLKTQLHLSPYFNVHDTGSICSGSAKKPKTISPATIYDWEKGFFDSAFTHTNGSVKKVKFRYGEYGFWKSMLDGKIKTFESKYLVPTSATLGSVLKKISQK